MDDSLVYRKSGLGAAQLAASHSDKLSGSERHVLILLDGRRTIAELSDLFGADMVQRIVPQLEVKGFVKRVETHSEWDGAITQFHVGLRAGEAPEPALNPRWGKIRLGWIALALLLAGVGDYWAFTRFRLQTDTGWRPGQGLVEVTPKNLNHASRSTDNSDASPAPLPAPAPATPISRLLPVPRSTQTDAEPLARRVSPQSAAHRRRALAAAQGAEAGASARGVSTTAAASAATVDGSPAAPRVDGSAAAPPLDGLTNASGVTVALAPAAAPANEQIALRLLRHDPPQFPESARRDGIGQSQVRVRLWVTPEGKVDQVDIIEATPPGVFDDELRRALSLWTFEPPGRPAEQVMDLTLTP